MDFEQMTKEVMEQEANLDGLRKDGFGLKVCGVIGLLVGLTAWPVINHWPEAGLVYVVILAVVYAYVTLKLKKHNII